MRKYTKKKNSLDYQNVRGLHKSRKKGIAMFDSNAK